MTQGALFLVAVAAVAGYMVRLALKLAPGFSEFPLKTILASLLSAVVAFAEVLPYSVGEPLRWAVIIAAPLYAFGPLLAVWLARLGRYRYGVLLLSLLYWTVEGREAVRRLVVQVALQKGDAGEALRLIPEDDSLMLAQAYALREEWDRLVELQVPEEGDNSFLAGAARIEGLLALDRRDEAQRSLDRMRDRWEVEGQGPIGYRSIRLSEARLAAERGHLPALREILGQPLPGVPAHVLVAIFAHGARQAHRAQDSVRLYRQAFQLAPPAARERYQRALAALDAEPPALLEPPPRAMATYGIAAAVALAFAGQLWLDAAVGPLVALGSRFDPSTLAAAFLANLPGLPAADAWWRFLSYSWVHANVVHAGFNLWVLVDIGRVYEARRGPENLLASFAAGTAMGAVISSMTLAGQPQVLVGASAGVLGVAGALLADAMASRAAGDRQLMGSLLRWMGLIVLLSVAIPNVSLWGHVGGVVGGMLWGFLRQGLPAMRSLDALAGAIALALLSLSLFQAARLAFRLALL